MSLKKKLDNIYNLVITLLISLLLLMLYLGNYNLIEGNTTADIKNNLASSIENNKNSSKFLQNNRPYNSICDPIETMNKDNADYISTLGGAQTVAGQSYHAANEVAARLCANNKQT
jgi:hypothetical protein